MEIRASEVTLKNQPFERIMYFDYLRIIATAAVMIIHITAEKIIEPSVFSHDFNALLMYDSFARWSVPIFAMISGAIFLNNDIPLKTENLFRQNIFRIVTAFCAWSLFYSAEYALIYGDFSVSGFLARFFTGHYHMWFLFMIVGLYLVTPLMRKITVSEKLTSYFLVLSIVFTFFIPTIANRFQIQPLLLIVNNMQFYMTKGYICYFVAGYWLHRKDLSRLWQNVIYILGIAGFIATFVMTAGCARDANQFVAGYTDYFTINVMLESVAVFVFAKYRLSKLRMSKRIENFIIKLSVWSFGAYLVHAFVIEVLSYAGLHSLAFDPVISVPVIAVAVFAVSTAVSGVIHYIPVLKKYIV